MKTMNWKFYVDCAKFAGSLIGGGTAGYLLAKNANAIVNKVATYVEMKAIEKMAEKNKGDEQHTIDISAE